VAHGLADVVPVLNFAEEASRAGLWVVVLVSYEAARAFDNKLITHDLPDFPLVWVATFRSPQMNSGFYGLPKNLRQIPPTPLCQRGEHPWKLGLFPPLTKGGRGDLSLNQNRGAPVSSLLFPKTYDHTPWTARLDRVRYVEKIQKIKKWIARGDTYQVNFTFPLECEWSGSPRGWWSALGGSSVYLDLGRYKILSFSPELFFHRTPRSVWVRPMKGSAPRGLWPQVDRANAVALGMSEKDRAENLMIVDLLRNDLGKISRPGSVQTVSLFDVETYPSIHQMTSTLRAKGTVPLVKLFQVLFPSGSVTGAPKRRTMELIHSLEDEPRGAYTGAVGLLRPGGCWTFNVAIRTLTLDTQTGTARCPVGSGVTWPSQAGREYDECLLKSRFLSPSPRAGSPLETLRLEEGRWFLLKKHLDRMIFTAKRFGWSLNKKTVESVLRTVQKENPRGLHRVRLTMSSDGSPLVHVVPLGLVEPPWRVAISTVPVDRQDPFLYHKTTVRDVYDRQRGLRPDADDVLLVNERGALTESTRANLVVKKRGKFYTPPVKEGLLPGVFRQQGLDRGVLRERTLVPGDLLTADGVYLINSVRKWIPVEMIS